MPAFCAKPCQLPLVWVRGRREYLDPVYIYIYLPAKALVKYKVHLHNFIITIVLQQSMFGDLVLQQHFKFRLLYILPSLPVSYVFLQLLRHAVWLLHSFILQL